MHTEAFEYVNAVVAELGPFHSVVEIGGRDINGSVKPLFGEAQYTSVDISDGPGVDVVMDFADWQVGQVDFVDCVVCCEVLEHAINAPKLIEAAWNLLRPGGVFIMTCATFPRAPHSAINGELLMPGHAEYYLNISPERFTRWAAGFSEVRHRLNSQHGDLYATCVK